MPALGLIANSYEQVALGQGQVGVKLRNQVRFLECYAVCGSVSQAARWAKVGRGQHHEWMRSDPHYKARFAEADKRWFRSVEDTAAMLAVQGVEAPILYKGKQVYLQGRPLVEIKRSERILERLLEAGDKEKYGRKGDSVNLLNFDPSKLSNEQLEALGMQFLRQMVGDDPEALAEARKQVEAAVLVTAEVVESAPPSTVEESLG